MARRYQAVYTSRCKSCRFDTSLGDFWSQNTTEAKGQLPHASQANLEGVREAGQTQTGCLARNGCDCKLIVWHKHHKVNLWMTTRNTWLFFPLLFLLLHVKMSRSSLANSPKTRSGRWCFKDIGNSRTCWVCDSTSKMIGHLGIVGSL